MTDADNQNAIVLITGANRGLGFEIARQLGAQGMTVIVGARSQDKADEAVETLKGEDIDAHGQVIDVADEDSVKQAAAAVESQFGRLDILLNNAAGFVDWSETATTADLNATRNLLEINLLGAWRTVLAFLPLLQKSDQARIVNVSSGAGLHSDPNFGLTSNNGAVASYGVSKAALNALTVKLAMELQESGIPVNAAGPNLTATAPGMEQMGARPVSEGAASIVQVVNMPRDVTGKFFRDGAEMDW